MEPATSVALVSIVTAFVTTAGGVTIAVLTNRREAENAVDDARDGVMAQRLTLRDEQIEALEWKVRNREARIVDVETRAAVLQAELNQTKADLADARAELARRESRGPHA